MILIQTHPFLASFIGCVMREIMALRMAVPWFLAMFRWCGRQGSNL